MAHLSINAGPIHWGALRRAAGLFGVSLEESKGWLNRTFIFRGDDETIAALNDAVHEYMEKIKSR